MGRRQPAAADGPRLAEEDGGLDLGSDPWQADTTCLGPPAIGATFLTHFFFGWEGSPTKIDYSKKGNLILTSQIWRT